MAQAVRSGIGQRYDSLLGQSTHAGNTCVQYAYIERLHSNGLVHECMRERLIYRSSRTAAFALAVRATPAFGGDLSPRSATRDCGIVLAAPTLQFTRRPVSLINWPKKPCFSVS